jgi:polysaccharide deacetylase family protein (PEP-CTERM system associated)
VVNALTIDLEDWRQLAHRKITGQFIRPTADVVTETDFLLELLARAGVRATFFVLGNVAEAYPGLICRIDAACHEIASHGLTHTLVYRQSIAEFRAETRRAKALLEDTIGRPVVGYRAAEFSITIRSWSALQVLAEEGFRYDSSVFPIAGRRYGVGSAPLGPHTVTTSGGARIVEFPPTAVVWCGRRWPIAGGGYFRVLPYAVTRAALRRVNAEERPGVVYLHPYEFAPDRLTVPVRSRTVRRLMVYLRYGILHNLGRQRIRERFERLLADFQFAPIREVLHNV